MPSPLPGMDPWLEAEDVFPDLHDRFILGLSDALNAAMPPGYVSITRMIVWTEKAQRRVPDVSLFGRRPRPSGGGTAILASAGMYPLGQRAPGVRREESYLEITAPKSRRLVTAVEVLSPSNKAAGSEGRRAYLKKQKEFRIAGVNTVEFDFLRGGVHTTAAPRPRLTRLAGGDFPYHVCAVEGPDHKVLGNVFPLARPLPPIGVALDPGVERVRIELQPILDRAYDAGRYADFIDYSDPCVPPLPPEEQAWAEGVLRARTNLHGEK